MADVVALGYGRVAKIPNLGGATLREIVEWLARHGVAFADMPPKKVQTEIRGIHAHPDDAPAIKALAEKLQRKRAKVAKEA